MAKNTFTKQLGSTYKCECCGRGTRNTGSQSMGSKTCPQCWELAGIENEISDGHTTLDEQRATIDALIAEIIEKGGIRAAVEESFSALLPVAVTAVAPKAAAPSREDVATYVAARVLHLIEHELLSPVEALRVVCGADVVDAMIDAVYTELRAKASR